MMAKGDKKVKDLCLCLGSQHRRSWSAQREGLSGSICLDWWRWWCSYSEGVPAQPELPRVVHEQLPS